MSDARTILIIDDDRDYVAAIQHLFEHRGHIVLSAGDGRAGFDRAREARPDLILLDVMMAERTEGFFTLQRIRRDPGLRDTPIMVVSSIYSQCPHFTVDPQAGWLQADAFLAKPVEPATLLEQASRLMAAGDRRRAEGSAAS